MRRPARSLTARSSRRRRAGSCRSRAPRRRRRGRRPRRPRPRPRPSRPSGICRSHLRPEAGVREERRGHRRLDERRRDRVHADAVRRQLDGRRLGEPLDGVLGGAVDRPARGADVAHLRRERARSSRRPAATIRRAAAWRRHERGADVELEQRVEVLVGHVDAAARGCSSRALTTSTSSSRQLGDQRRAGASSRSRRRDGRPRGHARTLGGDRSSSSARAADERPRRRRPAPARARSRARSRGPRPVTSAGAARPASSSAGPRGRRASAPAACAP